MREFRESLSAAMRRAEEAEASAAVTLQTFTLELIGPPENHTATISASPLTKDMLDEMKENLTDLLPDGYSVRIREWDAEEDNPQ